MKRSQQWKAWEREVAADMGGDRTGPTGKNTPDVSNLYNGFAPECKYQKKLSLKEADLQQAERNANGNQWGLFLREAQTGRRFVVVPYKVFLGLWDAYKENTHG